MNLKQLKHYHADLQPAVGCCEEERGDVVGISELQQPLSEPGLIPASGKRHGSLLFVLPPASLFTVILLAY